MGISQLMDVIHQHANLAVKTVTSNNLSGKVIAIDAYITMYQFLAIANSDMATFINGIFIRTVNLIEHGIRPVYVFDGNPPGLKGELLTKRNERHANAVDAEQSAQNGHLYNGSAGLSAKFIKVLPKHVVACKTLLANMGVPFVDAPGEGEAQCAHLVKSGMCYAVGSEDMDTLPFGCGILLRGLKFSGSSNEATEIRLEKVLIEMGFTQDEFIDLCILLGSDYVESIRGIGKVKAVQLIKEYRSIEQVIAHIDKSKHPVPTGWIKRVRKVRKFFKNPDVISGTELSFNWTAPKEACLIKFLCVQYNGDDKAIRQKIEVLKSKLGTTGISGGATMRMGSLPQDEAIAVIAAKYLHGLSVAPDDYTRMYVSEFKRYFEIFRTKTSSAKGHSADDIMKYLRKKKYVYFKRSEIILKPVYINLQNEECRIFIIYPGALEFPQFYVCLICNRGFTTYHGLEAHQISKSHLDQANREFSPSNTTLNFHQWSTRSVKIKNTIITGQDRTSTGAAYNSTAGDASLTCETCNIRCTSQFNMEQHFRGQKHAMNQNRDTYRNNRQSVLRNQGEVEVSFDGEKDLGEDAPILNVIGKAGASRTVKFLITNTSKKLPVIFESCTVHELVPGLTIIKSDACNVTSSNHLTMRPSERYSVHITIRPTYLGQVRVPILFQFRRGDRAFTIGREVLYKCIVNQEIFEELAPSTPFQRVKIKVASYNSIVRSDVTPDIEKNYELERTVRLDNYSIPSSITEALKDLRKVHQDGDSEENLNSLIMKLGLKELDFSTYSYFFNNLMYLEEHQCKIDIGHYTLEGAPMRKDERTGLIRLTVPGLAENRPSVLRGDRLYITHIPPDGRKYEGHVHNVTLTELFLGFSKRLVEKFINNMKFRVEFTINRLTIKLEHRAVSWAGEHNFHLEKVLFPCDSVRLSPFRKPETTKLKHMNTNIPKNLEQATAVKHIVCGTSRPAPYLIYGPPGTGKTFTLVEAIKQVYKECPGSRILACAPQNAAADLLTSRLLDHISKHDVLRVNALSRAYGDIEKNVQEVSNYKSKAGVHAPGKHALSGASKRGDMEVEYPNKRVLMQRRIIVSTLVTSGRLVSADMNGHFTHIFIDEAGHATEPETVIPLAGLLDIHMSQGGQVVLAGDPKQLGPIIRSAIAASRGLGKSLLERLMSENIYKRDQATGEFNPYYVTKLVQSFRSHPEILEVPNSCFYDNELQAHADKVQRQRFCRWEELPTQNFPLIFHGVDGEEEREGNSPSWFNRYEVVQVINYVQKLFDCKNPKVKPEHVGIISPYHQQVNKIKRALQALQTKGRTRNYADIKVGSVEKFQGDEREIIIISTVRSQDAYLTHDKDFNLGFVGNPKRFNVAITRAKALLIVIGNPAILRQDKNWLRKTMPMHPVFTFSLLNHIEEGGGYVGCPLPGEDEQEEPVGDLSEKFESMNLKESLKGDVSEALQQGDQEWTRKE